MAETVGFIGLGQMGTPIVENLLKAGFGVVVYNRTRAKAEALEGKGARVVDSPAEVARAAKTVSTIVADDAALDAITTGEDGLLSAMGTEHLHIAMSTVAPATTRRMAELHAASGAGYIASPVFGRPDAAAAAKLWVIAAGPAALIERARPLHEAIGQGVFTYGADPAAASVVKLCGNFMIMAAIEAMGEAWALAEKNGVAREAMAETFGKVLFGCPVYQGYGKLIANESYSPAGFPLRLGLKDARLVTGAADASGVPMPLASLVRDRYLAGVARGRGELDWSALALAASEDAGLRED